MVEPAQITRPCGLTVLDRAQVKRLKDMITVREEGDRPIMVLGFSAGAYLALTAARERLSPLSSSPSSPGPT